MTLSINTNSLPGHKAGDTINVETKGGVIRDRYWRNRLSDAKFDNCVSIVDNKSTDNIQTTGAT